MAYNNGFPVGYQPYYPPQYIPQYQQQIQQPSALNQQNLPSQTNNNMIWVQGIAGAKSYLLAPNETATLWDSEAQIIYLKSTDSSGMPTMKILDYTIREDQNAKISDESVATKQDIEALRNELERMNSRIDSLSYKKDYKKEHVKNE